METTYLFSQKFGRKKISIVISPHGYESAVLRIVVMDLSALKSSNAMISYVCM